MKKLLLSFTLSFFSLLSYSQNFQPGYYIDNEGERIFCLIDNTEDIVNPNSFQYKLSQESETKQKTIDEVQVFEILETPYKFERAVVNLDLSQDNNFKKLNEKREPNFRTDTLFLQVSIEGDASLYLYRNKDLPKRFFYSIGESKIEPLIYKKYLVDETKIRTNNRYKQQLLNELKCPKLKRGVVTNAKYSQKSLNNIFTLYNRCRGNKFENFNKKKRKGTFNIAVKAGINYSAIKLIQEPPFSNEQELDAYLSPRIGIELEYVFPFLNDKLSIISYPSYQYSTTSEEALIYINGSVPSNPGGRAAEKEVLLIDYSRLILPFGVRYYYYMGKDVNLYIQGAGMIDFLTNASRAYNFENFRSNFNFENTTADPYLDIATGVKYRKMSLDIIYSVNNVMRNEGLNGKMKNSITLNFGYKIL